MLVVACTKTITYQVTYPPIKLPESINSTVIVHRLDSTADIMDNRKKNQLFHTAYAIFSNKLRNKLDAEVQITIYTDTVIAEKPFSKEVFERPVNEDLMNSLVNHFGKDLLIVIENFKVFQSHGFTISDDEKRKYTTVYVMTTISLYDRSVSLIKRTILESNREVDRGEFEDFPGLLFGPSLMRFNELINGMALELVDDYIERLYQRSEQVTRVAYSGSDFKGFSEMIQTGRFAQAEALLLPLTQDSKYDILMKSAYNMYILREAEGRIDESEEWLNKYQFYRNMVRQKYEVN